MNFSTELYEEKKSFLLSTLKQAHFPTKLTEQSTLKKTLDRVFQDLRLEFTFKERGLRIKPKLSPGRLKVLKITPGHRCMTKEIHTMEGEETDELSDIEQEYCADDLEIDQNQNCNHTQAMITMCSSSNLNHHQTLKIKGHLGTIPIIALIDSGSTHSYIKPDLVNLLSLPTTTASTLTVTTASDHPLSTTKLCENPEFQLQGHTFHGNLRVLRVNNFDLLLGMDWLNSYSPMNLYWPQEKINFILNRKKVTLQAQPVTAEIRLCEETLDLQKEQRQGNQVIIARLFTAEGQETSSPQVCNSQVQLVLDQFSDVFSEPHSLPPKRTIEHQIPLKPD